MFNRCFITWKSDDFGLGVQYHIMQLIRLRNPFLWAKRFMGYLMEQFSR